MQFFNGDGLADDRVGLKMHAFPAQGVDLRIHDAVRQTELWDAIFQYAADLMQRLEDIDLEAFLHHVAGEAQS